MNSLTITILAIILSTLIAGFVKRTAKDKCIKDFKHNNITLLTTENKFVTGRMIVEGTGLEFVFTGEHIAPRSPDDSKQSDSQCAHADCDTDRKDEVKPSLDLVADIEAGKGLASEKSGKLYSYLLYKTEFARIAALIRYHKNLSEKDFADFDRLIHRSVEIKNEIVKQDPTENGIRKALNFGHTLGHAIESYFLENENKKTLLHGEAIAVGMILESFISNKLNLITKEELAEIKYIISDLFEKINIEANDVKPIMELLIHDKKNEYGKIQFALLKNIGNFSVNQTVENSLIEEAFNDYLL